MRRGKGGSRKLLGEGSIQSEVKEDFLKKAN